MQRIHRARATVLSTAAAAALVSSVGLSVAQAAPVESQAPSEAREAAVDGYCVTDVDRSTTKCYETDAAASRAAGKNLILKVWGKPNKEGKSHRFKTAGANCNFMENDLRFIKDHSGRNWNNRISSLKTYHGCTVSLYGRSFMEGQHTGWLRNEDRLGRLPTGWNNAATSFWVKEA
ncbi:hypothetical protein SAMN04489812_5135 [Microlunatus soli]|uniref:Peptidase inhibitor family I36 n=2 Tax=Microlunatus soli TaxID=630515 RepID=A0A1H1ZCN7_9ACTN|nr:hypothetical protein SAMN04489812_5135 [Microlunatus soli]